MNREFNHKLYKSIFHSIKPKCIFFGIVFVSLFFANFYGVYRTWISCKGEDIALKEYGSYRLLVSNLDEKGVEKIVSEIKDTAVVYSEYSLTEDAETEYVRFDYVDENYFNISNCQLIKGSFPKNRNEILCESRYLTARGIEFNGTSVRLDINEKNYTVTGEIIFNNNFISSAGYTPIMMSNLKYAEPMEDSIDFSVLCGGFSEKTFAESADVVKKKCGIKGDDIAYNNNYLSFLDIDEFGQTENVFFRILDVAFYPIICIMSLVFAFGFYLVTGKLRTEFGKMRLLGINSKELYKAIAAFLFIVFIALSILTIMISGLIGAVFFGSSIFPKLDWVKVVLVNLLYCFVSIGISLLFTVKDNRKKVLEQVRSQNRKDKKNTALSYIEKAKFPFWRVASINIKLKKSYVFCSIVCIGISIVLIGAFLYCTFFVEKNNSKKEYDYRIEYMYAKWAEQFDGSEKNYKMYQRLINDQDLVDVFPVFNTKVLLGLRKNNMSPEMVEFIKNTDPEKNKDLAYIDNSVVKISGCILGANVSELKKVYGLNDIEEEPADDECIVLENIVTQNGAYIYTGISEGDTVKYDYLDSTGGELHDEQLNFKVKRTVPDLELSSEKYSGFFTIIVNHKVYEKISSYKYDYPELIYLNAKNGTDAQIKDMFFGETEVNLINQNQEKETRNEYYSTVYLAVYSFFVILTIIMVFYTILTFISIYNNNIKQTAILKGLGLSTGKLFFINGYVVIRNAVDSLLIGNGLLVAVLYFIYKYINNNFYMITFSLPNMGIVLIPNVTIIVLLILTYVYMFMKIRRMNSVAVLKED